MCRARRIPRFCCSCCRYWPCNPLTCGNRLRLYHLTDRQSTRLILLVIAVLVTFSGMLDRLDKVIYDTGQRLFTRPAPSDLIIVGIDEQSLFSMGRWPWPRQTHADLVTRLKDEGARVIGLDLVFAEPDTGNPASDDALINAVAYAGNVVMPVLMESSRVNGQMVETLPMPMLTARVAGLGRAHGELDADGIARSVFLWEGIGTPGWPHFAQAVLAVADALPPGYATTPHAMAESQPYMLVRHDERKINFLGPPGYVSTVSYVQVLAGEFPAGLFKDKIVLVGATAAGMGDLLPTPVSGLRQPMAGVEFHANVLESMRKNTLIKDLPLWLTTLLCGLLALLPMLWLPMVSPLIGLVSSGLLFIVLIFATMALPLSFHIWLPTSGALLAVLIAYPVWSWRKLESAGRFLDRELLRLRQELKWMERRKDKNRTPASDDPFQNRILQVQAVTERLKQIDSQRKEVLAFISHDIRAPLASAIMQLDEAGDTGNRLYPSLARALSLAEEFLHTSRAEMSDSASFQELDLAAVLHQALDDIYMDALEKSVRLLRDLPDDPVWIRGHFGLLHRAVLNLLLNAVKFSPVDSVVKLSLELTEQQATVSVIDQGPGIAPEEQDKLFQRFTRTDSQGKAPEGSGLGLYFVRTVAEKHGGRVSVSSEAARTVFRIHLPLMK
ncbi:Alkaline phosphatase synthesis sensor protein PhoR [Methylophilaceae bacterium]|nr:Alkaline phosphatase synthesis sensor protein PhoR [Methylophilaceae bacterium]